MHIGNCLYNISNLEFRLLRCLHNKPSLRPLLGAVLNQLKSKTNEHALQSEESFNNDVSYRDLVIEMLELHSTVQRAFSSLPRMED